jgi:hypothetical protein
MEILDNFGGEAIIVECVLSWEGEMWVQRTITTWCIRVPTYVLVARKNKLIIFRWESILSMDAVFKHEYYLIFKHISLYMNDFRLV